MLRLPSVPCLHAVYGTHELPVGSEAKYCSQDYAKAPPGNFAKQQPAALKGAIEVQKEILGVKVHLSQTVFIDD